MRSLAYIKRGLPLAGCCFSIAVAVSPASAENLADWGPVFGYAKAGGYCRSDVNIKRGSRGPRPPRDGSIIVRDYEEPLRALVSSAAPADGKISLGSSTIVVQRGLLGSGARLRTGGGLFGVSFVNRSAKAIHQRLQATARLMIQGGGNRTIAFRRALIPSLHRGERHVITLPTGEQPGIYRYELTLRNTNGAGRARIVDFVRVLPPRLQVRVGSKSNSYSAGDVVYVRLENLGTDLIRERSGYDVERLETNGAWQRIGPNTIRGPRIIELGRLGAGKARCVSFQIPDDTLPGQYRFVKEIEVDSQDQALIREFLVN